MKQKKQTLKDFEEAFINIEYGAKTFIDDINEFIAEAGDWLTPEQGISLMTSRDETLDTIDRLREVLQRAKDDAEYNIKWKIRITRYGTFDFTGSEDEAEEMRAYKCKSEQAVGIKWRADLSSPLDKKTAKQAARWDRIENEILLRP